MIFALCAATILRAVSTKMVVSSASTTILNPHSASRFSQLAQFPAIVEMRICIAFSRLGPSTVWRATAVRETG